MDNVTKTRAATHSEWQLAYALHAGLGVALDERATLVYRLQLHPSSAMPGRAKSRRRMPRFPNDPFVFRNLHSHDIKVGLRYRFN